MKRQISLGLFLCLVLPLLAIIAGGARYVVQTQWKIARLNTTVDRLERTVAANSEAKRATGSAVPTAILPAGPRVISPTQRATILAGLATEAGPTKEVWFTRDNRDSEAGAYQRALQGVFEEAGWTVRGNTTATFSMRPGIFFLMADNEPPAFVLTARTALQDAGLTLISGRDYRAFNNRKKAEDPNWRGFDMAEDQPYIIAIGRKPKAE